MKASLGLLILGLAIFGHSHGMEIQGFLNAGLKPASGSANGFKTAKYIQYTSIYKATNFDDAHTECAKVGATLMPIGKLRYFKPTFENIKDVAWKEYGWFRICARKTATGWEEKHPNGTFIPLVSSNFPNVNNTIGTLGSSLVWHPAYPNDLYIVKDSISTSGNYWLMPLCYKPKPEIQVCETTKQSCCDNGDCINGQCSCYAGFWAPKNCCCKEFKVTLSLGVANTAVAITIDGVVNNLVTDANGKVQVSGCEAGTVQARSIAALSGTIKIEGYCETSFSASGSSGSEISITLIQSKVTVKIGLANTAVVVTMDGTKTELISDANGKIEMNTCGQAKSGTIKVQGYCETALEIPANKNEIEVTLKQSGSLTLLAIEKATNEPFVARPIIVDGTELKTSAKGMLTVEKCIGDTVKVELKPTLTCCTSKALEIKISSKETARVISVAKKSELDIKVKDVETCEIVPGVEITTTLSSGVNSTKYSSSFGVPIKFPDCHEAKSKLFTKKDGYCDVIEEVKRVDLKTEKDLFIRKHQDVEVIVRDLNNKPIDDITVLLVTETEVRHMNVTTFLGRTEFHDLCYGQDALITVNGASFDNEHCQDKKVPIVVGQAKTYTVKVDC